MANRRKGSRSSSGSATTSGKDQGKPDASPSTASPDQPEDEAAAVAKDKVGRDEAKPVFSMLIKQLRAAVEARKAGGVDLPLGDTEQPELPLIERSPGFLLVEGLKHLQRGVLSLDAGADGQSIAQLASWLTGLARSILAARAGRSEALTRFIEAHECLADQVQAEFYAFDAQIRACTAMLSDDPCSKVQ